VSFDLFCAAFILCTSRVRKDGEPRQDNADMTHCG